MKRLIAAGAALTALALGACSPSPSTAVVTGDTSVSQATLSAATVGCATVLKTDQSTLRLQILQTYARAEIAKVLANKFNVDVSQDALTKKIKQKGSALIPLLSNTDCAQVANNLMFFEIVQGAIPVQQLLIEASKIDIRVNPRYGQWNTATLAIEGSGSLSALAPRAQK